MSTGLLLGVLLLHLIPDAANDMKTGLNGIRKLTSMSSFELKNNLNQVLSQIIPGHTFSLELVSSLLPLWS